MTQAPELVDGVRAAGPGASRRSVLRTAGMVALAGGGAAAFAACSSDAATPAVPAEPAPASSSAAASSSPTPSASSSAPSSPSATAASSSAAAPSGPSVSTAEVPVGGGFIMPDADYVVTQPEKGTFKAFGKKCTHQGCPVSQIADQEIICRCHNSHFSISDGSVVSGPAKSPLPEAKTTVSGKNVVITT
ncbi:MAG TPA: Rieske (2Fe-2S) protein [Propionibacteriaceae bacterium]